MSEIRKKLTELSGGEAGNGTERIHFRRENSAWLKKSQAVGVRILATLRAKSMTQVQLAELMGVAPPQINKIVKGRENLQLDTITALEKALGIVLLEVPKEEKKVAYERPRWNLDHIVTSNKQIISLTSELTLEFQFEDTFANEQEFI